MFTMTIKSPSSLNCLSVLADFQNQFSYLSPQHLLCRLGAGAESLLGSLWDGPDNETEWLAPLVL
jgi:hypothetical protein